ncbi:MAG: amino acid racemase [Proteobacteria bacterium]|nr:amino acid racemase [Pseudomonadota bacterium]
MTEPLTVGVIGGLGPVATADFFAKVVAQTPARIDQDHVRLIVDNNPKVPNRNEAMLGRGPSPGPHLAAMASGLQRAGADFLVMPCNAAHAWQDDIVKASGLPFVSLIAETVAATRSRIPECTAVGVLAADACLAAGLYPAAFAGSGVRVIELAGADQEAFMALIYRIKTGDRSSAVRSRMREMAMKLVARGASAVIAGCTEVPLALTESELGCSLINSTDVLVERTIAYATGREPIPGDNRAQRTE